MHRLLARSLAGIILLTAFTAVAQADPVLDGAVHVRQIPISTWLQAQAGGSLVILEGRVSSVPFAPIGNTGYVDYANGLADAAHLSYGFSASGTVLVTTNPDGTGLVRLNESFSNALDWTYNSSNALIFGYTATELAHATGTAALANGHMQAVYTVADAENPELNLVKVLFYGGGVLQEFKFYSEASGPLRAAFGRPDGTPGKSVEANTGVLNAGGGGATADGFPVEHVDVFATGARGAALDGPSRPNDAAGTWGAIRALYR